jgi:hypothetical protein
MKPLEPMRFSYDTLQHALKDADLQPYIKLTQGGSSRRDRGAKPAAYDANLQRSNNGKS